MAQSSLEPGWGVVSFQSDLLRVAFMPESIMGMLFPSENSRIEYSIFSVLLSLFYFPHAVGWKSLLSTDLTEAKDS